MVLTGQEAEIYTVTFVCLGKAMTSHKASKVPTVLNKAEEVGILDLCLLIVLTVLSVGLFSYVIRTTGKRTRAD